MFIADHAGAYLAFNRFCALDALFRTVSLSLKAAGIHKATHEMARIGYSAYFNLYWYESYLNGLWCYIAAIWSGI